MAAKICLKTRNVEQTQKVIPSRETLFDQNISVFVLGGNILGLDLFSDSLRKSKAQSVKKIFVEKNPQCQSQRQFK